MKFLLENYHQLSKIIPELAVPPCGYKPALLCVKPPKRIYIMHDIVDTAVAAGSFKTLVAAVTAAGLVETLGSGPLKSTFAASKWQRYRRKMSDAGSNSACKGILL
jgi:hypothetical protein